MIIDAIEGNRRLKVNYKGGYRTLEPYCYGISTAGNDSLRAYQIDGYSNCGESTNWKFMNTKKIEDIQLLNDNFIPNNPDYSRGDKMMKVIYKQI